MRLFVVLNLLATVSCAYNYYSDDEWASAPQQQQYQDFNPSSKYDTAYPDTLYANNVNQNQNIYDYAILASNLVEGEDLFATDSLINEDVDRQVVNPVEEVAPIFEGFAPFIATSALILGISALFANVVNLNSTASNTSVPFGLWALPELPQITNLSLPNIGGRKRRDANDGAWYEDVYELNNAVDADLEDSKVSKLFKILSTQNPNNILQGLKKAVTIFALMDDNSECQAAFGCRYGKQLKEMNMLDDINTFNSLLDLIQPFKWDTFTSVFRRVAGENSSVGTDCSAFQCHRCLSIED